MSTIWTPSGEHRVPKEPGDGQPEHAGGQPAGQQNYGVQPVQGDRLSGARALLTPW